MEYVTDTLNNLAHQTAFLSLGWGNYLMIAIACLFLYLAIKKGYEPLLLVPIAFGMLLVNIYPDIMASGEDGGTEGLFHFFFRLDEWSILPSLIFLGVGAMTDFGPLIANPKSFLLGAAAQFGIFAAYLLAIGMNALFPVLEFNDKAAAAISIIGGADGPTSIFLAGKLGQTALLGPIAVMGAKGAIEILYGKELSAITNPEEKAKFIAEKEEEYNTTFANPYKAASYGYIDDVIEPRNTRFRVIRAFQSLQTKRVTNPMKKHSNIPL